MPSITNSGFRQLNQFNLVTFGRVDERESAAAVRAHSRAVRIFESKRRDVPGKFFEAIDFKSQMREVWLNLNRAGVGKVTKLNQFFALRRFQKNQLRTSGRFMPAHFFQTEDLFVEFHAALQIIQAISSVQKFFSYHGKTIGVRTGAVIQVLIPNNAEIIKPER